MTENTAQVTESVGGEAPAQEQPQLSIADLQNLRTVLDVASRRGAFGANEMTSVGAVFDRLDKFLNAVAPAQQPAGDNPEQPA
jgi:hypothetical protein